MFLWVPILISNDCFFEHLCICFLLQNANCCHVLRHFKTTNIWRYTQKLGTNVSDNSRDGAHKAYDYNLQVSNMNVKDSILQCFMRCSNNCDNIRLTSRLNWNLEGWIYIARSVQYEYVWAFGYCTYSSLK